MVQHEFVRTPGARFVDQTLSVHKGTEQVTRLLCQALKSSVSMQGPSDTIRCMYMQTELGGVMNPLEQGNLSQPLNLARLTHFKQGFGFLVI